MSHQSQRTSRQDKKVNDRVTHAMCLCNHRKCFNVDVIHTCDYQVVKELTEVLKEDRNCFPIIFPQHPPSHIMVEHVAAFIVKFILTVPYERNAIHFKRWSYESLLINLVCFPLEMLSVSNMFVCQDKQSLLSQTRRIMSEELGKASKLSPECVTSQGIFTNRMM